MVADIDNISNRPWNVTVAPAITYPRLVVLFIYYYYYMLN